MKRNQLKWPDEFHKGTSDQYSKFQLGLELMAFQFDRIHLWRANHNPVAAF